MKKITWLIVLSCMPSLTIASSQTPLGIDEIVLFTAQHNTTPGQIIKAFRAVTTVLQHYPGFISRHLAENTQNPANWMDTVHWSSLSDAQFAAKHVMRNSSMQAFVSLMRTYHMDHFIIKTSA